MPITTVRRATALTTSDGTVLTTSDTSTALAVSTSAFVLGMPPQVNPAYLIYIYDHTLNVVAQFNNHMVLALDYEIQLNAVSTCALTVLADTEQADLLQRDFILAVHRHNQIQYVYEHAYFIRDIEIFEEEGGVALITVGGLSLEDVLAGLIVDPDSDPLVANGYSTKSGFAESVMHEYVEEQLRIRDEEYPAFFRFSVDKERGHIVGARVRHNNLLDLVQRLSSAGRIDFRVVIFQQYLFFVTEIYGRGLSKRLSPNRYLLFSKKRGNLISPSITYDYRETQNAAYVLGPGEAENRLVYRRDNTVDVSATPFSRREFVVDAGSTEPGSSLEALTKADEELFEKRPKIRMDFTLVQSTTHSRYQLDWYLGDYATVEYRGREQDVRITKVTIGVRGAVETIGVTVEEYNDVF